MSLFSTNYTLAASSPFLKGQDLCFFLKKMDKKETQTLENIYIEKQKNSLILSWRELAFKITGIVFLCYGFYKFTGNLHKYKITAVAILGIAISVFKAISWIPKKQKDMFLLQEIARLKSKIDFIRERLNTVNVTQVEEYQLPRARVFFENRLFELENKHFMPAQI